MAYQMRIHQCSSIPIRFFFATQFRRVCEKRLEPKGRKFRSLIQARKLHCRPNWVNPREATSGQKRRRNSGHSGERGGRRMRQPRRRRRLRRRRRQQQMRWRGEEIEAVGAEETRKGSAWTPSWFRLFHRFKVQTRHHHRINYTRANNYIILLNYNYYNYIIKCCFTNYTRVIYCFFGYVLIVFNIINLIFYKYRNKYLVKYSFYIIKYIYCKHLIIKFNNQNTNLLNITFHHNINKYFYFEE